jgi:hypothetical protein
MASPVRNVGNNYEQEEEIHVRSHSASGSATPGNNGPRRNNSAFSAGAMAATGRRYEFLTANIVSKLTEAAGQVNNPRVRNELFALADELSSVATSTLSDMTTYQQEILRGQERENQLARRIDELEENERAGEEFHAAEAEANHAAEQFLRQRRRYATRDWDTTGEESVEVNRAYSLSDIMSIIWDKIKDFLRAVGPYLPTAAQIAIGIASLVVRG